MTAAQVEDKSLKPIQYLAPGLLGWAIVFGAAFGAAITLVGWRKDKLLRRLRLSPVSTWSVVTARIGMSVAIAVVQMFIFIAIAVTPYFGLRSAGREYRAGSSLGPSGSRLHNRHQRRANRVIGVRQDRRPMCKMDRFPRPIVRRRIRTRMRIRARANILANADQNQDPNHPRPHLRRQLRGHRGRLRTAASARLPAWSEPIRCDTRVPGCGAGAPPSGPVTLTNGMLLPIRTSEPLDSKKVKPGDYFQGTVAQSVYVGNVLAIPRGAQVTGRVVDVKKPGELKGGASIALQLTNLNLGGNSYSLATDVFNTNSPGKGGYTAGNTVGAPHWVRPSEPSPGAARALP